MRASLTFASMVSIHVPLAEHDGEEIVYVGQAFEFQFTCPSRSTTAVAVDIREIRGGFNSRAPRGARPTPFLPSAAAPAFQFTCPSRSTTLNRTMDVTVTGVSIHVPLAEHDQP